MDSAGSVQRTLLCCDRETAAAAVDTRGYCSTTFAEWLAGCQTQVDWMLCTHQWYTQSLYNDISEKSQCNQLGLAKSITTTINRIKYARSTNVAWSRSVAQGRLRAQGLSKCTLSILTCRAKDPPASFCLICLPGSLLRLHGARHSCWISSEWLL